jgi:hypothetical protein
MSLFKPFGAIGEPKIGSLWQGKCDLHNVRNAKFCRHNSDWGRAMEAFYVLCWFFEAQKLNCIVSRCDKGGERCAVHAPCPHSLQISCYAISLLCGIGGIIFVW